MQHTHEVALLLARFQFAFTVGAHIVFPAFSIGLASYLAVLEGLWLKTKKDVFLDLYRYWVKVFSLVFGMGVVSGLVMAYQFGTNWSVFSQKAGPITGVLLSYEVLTAFFLEAGFLGIMLFGMNKVGKKLHYLATCTVAFGTLVSATWILASNSWMQTPRGFRIDPVTGQFLPVDWLAIIFNPSFPYRLVHMGLAAFLCVAFSVGATAAWHLLRDRKKGIKETNKAVKTMFSMALWMITIVAPLQFIAGDMHGLNTLKYQPAKIAAMEGDWDSESRAPELLFGIPDMKEERTKYAIKIPYAGSLILTHSLEGKVPGLKDFPANERAPSQIVFFSFRIMIALGCLMILAGFISLWLRYRQRFYESTFFQKFMVLMGPSGFLALLCGWVTTEVGRQPWTVYGQLRTADSVSPLAASSLTFSVVIFAVVYGSVFGTGIVFLLRMLNKQPVMHEEATDDDNIRIGMHPELVGSFKGGQGK